MMVIAIRNKRKTERKREIDQEKNAAHVFSLSDTEQRLKRRKLTPKRGQPVTEKVPSIRDSGTKKLGKRPIWMESSSYASTLPIPMVTRSQAQFYNAWLEYHNKAAEWKLNDSPVNFELPKYLGPIMTRSKTKKLESEMRFLSNFQSSFFKSTEAYEEVGTASISNCRQERESSKMFKPVTKKPLSLTQKENLELRKPFGIVERRKGQRINACRMAVQKKIGPTGIRREKVANPVKRERKLREPVWINTLKGIDAFDIPVITRGTSRFYDTWLKIQEDSTNGHLSSLNSESSDNDRSSGIITRNLSQQMQLYTELLTNVPIGKCVPQMTNLENSATRPEELSFQFKQKNHGTGQDTDGLWKRDGFCKSFTPEKEQPQISEQQLQEAIARLDKQCQVPDDFGILKKDVCCSTDDDSMNSSIVTNSFLDEKYNPPVFHSLGHLMDKYFSMHRKGVKQNQKFLSDLSYFDVLVFNVTCESSLPSGSNIQDQLWGLQMAQIEKTAPPQQYDTENSKSLQCSPEIYQEQKINTMFQDGLAPQLELCNESTNDVTSENNDGIIIDNNIQHDIERVDTPKSKHLFLNSIIQPEFELHEMVNKQQNEAKETRVIKMYRVQRNKEFECNVPISKSKQEHDGQLFIQEVNNVTDEIYFQIPAVTSQPLTMQSSPVSTRRSVTESVQYPAQSNDVKTLSFCQISPITSCTNAQNPKSFSLSMPNQNTKRKFQYKTLLNRPDTPQQLTLTQKNQDTNVASDPKLDAYCEQSKNCNSKYGLQNCPICLQSAYKFCYCNLEIRDSLKQENTTSQTFPSQVDQEPTDSESTPNSQDFNNAFPTDEQNTKTQSFKRGISNLFTTVIRV